jgi:hypothetical protein
MAIVPFSVPAVEALRLIEAPHWYGSMSGALCVAVIEYTGWRRSRQDGICAARPIPDFGETNGRCPRPNIRKVLGCSVVGDECR